MLAAIDIHKAVFQAAVLDPANGEISEERFKVVYRRCPGEQLTIQVFEDFLRKVWKSGIEFHKLVISNPEPLPIGPTTVIADNVGFSRTI